MASSEEPSLRRLKRKVPFTNRAREIIRREIVIIEDLELLLVIDPNTREYVVFSIQRIEARGSQQTSHLNYCHTKLSELIITLSLKADMEKARVDMMKGDMISTFTGMRPTIT